MKFEDEANLMISVHVAELCACLKSALLFTTFSFMYER